MADHDGNGDEGIPEERPWRKREYSGASSTLGVAVLIVLAVGAAIWFFEFRGSNENSIADDGFGIIALDDALNPTGKPPAAEVGRAAPDFLLRSLDGGDTKLSDYRGKIVVVNIWASWCGPCKSEAPLLQEAHAANPEVVILGVNQQETPAAAQKFVDDFELTFPMALDRTGEISKVYRAQGPPLTVVIDAQGVIVRMLLGEVDGDELEAAIAEAS